MSDSEMKRRIERREQQVHDRQMRVQGAIWTLIALFVLWLVVTGIHEFLGTLQEVHGATS